MSMFEMDEPASLESDEPQVLLIVAVTTLVGLLSLLYCVYQQLSGPRKLLPLQEFIKLPFIRKEILSHDTRRFTFGLPSRQYVLGLPIGQHVSLKFTDEKTNKDVIRSYTPVESARGEVSLCIKVYRPAPPKFPNGGLMSQHLDDLKIGDRILLKGPKGHMDFYQAGKPPGSFHIKPLGKPAQERYVEQIGMLAGGTGITPMLQVLHEIFRNRRYAHISVKMIYANQTQDDILVRPELEALQKDFAGRFELWYTIDRVTGDASQWKYSTGFITKEMIQEHLLFDDKKKPTQFFMVCYCIVGAIRCRRLNLLFLIIFASSSLVIFFLLLSSIHVNNQNNAVRTASHAQICRYSLPQSTGLL